MYVAVMCLDAADSGAARAAALPAHQAYVDAHSELLVLSGPLLAPDGDQRAGQLFVLAVADHDQARRFIAEDPFTIAGVFGEIRVHDFQPRFRDGRRLSPRSPRSHRNGTDLP